jgi:hypothetical protein
LAFAAAGFVAFVCALSSSYGVREAQTAQWYYVLPGSAPEIVLLTQADGYVTAEYRPQPLTLYPVYRWREWKEHRAMYLIRTGALPKMAPIDANDPRILVPESPEPRLP